MSPQIYQTSWDALWPIDANGMLVGTEAGVAMDTVNFGMLIIGRSIVELGSESV